MYCLFKFVDYYFVKNVILLKKNILKEKVRNNLDILFNY